MLHNAQNFGPIFEPIFGPIFEPIFGPIFGPIFEPIFEPWLHNVKFLNQSKGFLPYHKSFFIFNFHPPYDQI